MNEALQLVKPNGSIGSINFYDLEDVFTIPAFEWGLGMADVTIRGGFCPGGALRAQKLLNLIKYDRINPVKHSTMNSMDLTKSKMHLYSWMKNQET
jgi:threonine dehydrogenase-like Zn-dependent dehydrogenase